MTEPTTPVQNEQVHVTFGGRVKQAGPGGAFDLELPNGRVLSIEPVSDGVVMVEKAAPILPKAHDSVIRINGTVLIYDGAAQTWRLASGEPGEIDPSVRDIEVIHDAGATA